MHEPGRHALVLHRNADERSAPAAALRPLVEGVGGRGEAGRAWRAICAPSRCTRPRAARAGERWSDWQSLLVSYWTLATCPAHGLAA